MFLRHYLRKPSSSLTLNPRIEARESPIHRLFHSAHTPTLIPLCNSSDLKAKRETNNTNSKLKEIKPVEENVPDPIADLPISESRSDSKNRKPDIILVAQSPFPEIQDPTFQQIFEKKIEIILTKCNFEIDDADKEAKEVKEHTLKEFITLVQNPQTLTSLPQELIDSLFDSISTVVFRDRASVSKLYLNPEDPIPFHESEMPHIALFYQLLQEMIKSCPTLSCFDEAFTRKLLKCFTTPDLEERLQAAQIIITILEKIPSMKPLIISTMRTNLTECFCNEMIPYVIHPTLTVLLYYFQKSPHIDASHESVQIYIKDVLLILGSSYFPMFSTAIQQVIEYFVKTAPTLVGSPTLAALVKHYPRTSVPKTISFLSMIATTLAKTPWDFKKYMGTIFKIYAEAAISSHIKVSNASMSIWHKIELESLIIDNSNFIFSTVMDVLIPSSSSQWSPDITKNIDLILQQMNRIDLFVFQELCRKKKNEKTPQNPELKKWAVLARAANRQDREVNLASKLAQIQMTFSKPEHRIEEKRKSLPSIHTNSAVVSSKPANPKALVKPKVLSPF
ncbi:phosphoprotein phosphatase [Histomonas meleagridis]|uniref:phosphoprotein phosphatase n=1 Tax=Histomonas meleagridis TaxID=135588 RepID=UPI00355A7C8C|nr:phosphoprotein phosphatase [Histomonas meleagridis]KAH0807000.1 phosphoprotein phosphatase [Histomonas meleagridis]